MYKTAVNRIKITSDNKYIISGGDTTIRIWDLLEKKQVAVLEGHTDYIYTLAISSDDEYIISGSKDKTIRIWNFLWKRQKLF